MTRVCIHVHGCRMTTTTERYGHKMFSFLTSSWGVRGACSPGNILFLNVEVKSINLVHFESNMRRSMDTSLNTHMKQNCKQIYFSLWIFYKSLSFQTVFLFINNNFYFTVI